MAKKSIWNRIKDWFTGGSSSSKSATKRVRSANSSYYSGGGRRSQSTSQSSYKKIQDSEEERRKKQRERQKEITASLDKIGKRADALSAGKPQKTVKQEVSQAGSGVKRAIKKMEQKSTPPDPKEKARAESREKATATLKKISDDNKQERKEWHEATGHRYDVNEKGISKEEKLQRRQNVKSRAFNNDTAVKEAEHAMKWHGKEESFARGALSGATFGASDLIAKKATTGEAAKAEEVYQKNKSKGYETAGEIVGSLASFGTTAAATDKLGIAAAKKLAPNAVEGLAKNRLVQNAAKRSVNKALEKGAIKGATKELIEQAGKEKAARIINAIGTDVAQNLTTGALYDINKASAEYDVGSSEWWKELGKSAAFNAAITGGVAGVSALRGGKRLAVEAADTLANRGVRNAAENADDAMRGVAEFPPRDNSTIEVINPNARANDVVEFGRPEEGIEVINPNARHDGGIVEIGRADDGIDVVNPDLKSKRKVAKRSAPRNEDMADIVSRYPAIEDAYLDYDGTIEAVNRYYDPEATAEAAVGRYYDLDIPSKVETAPPKLEDVETAPPRLEDVEAEMARTEAAKAEAPTAKDGTPNAKEARVADDDVIPFTDANGNPVTGEAPRQIDEAAEMPRADKVAESAETIGKSAEEPPRTVNDEIRESLSPEEQAKWTKAEQQEGYTAQEAEEIKGKNWRTNEEHTKRGGTTIGVGMGDKKYRGAIEEAIDNGDMTIEVYHDKENYEKGAQRVLAYAEGKGGKSGKGTLENLVERFESYQTGNLPVTSKESRDMLYDILAAVDYANGMENKELGERLFLSATKAGSELTSVSGLSLRQWHKIAMSSPDYRAKAVKQQIETMFNKSRGFRKKFGKIETTAKSPESFSAVDDAMPLDEFIKNNPKDTKGLDDALEVLKNAKSKEEVERAASDVLVEARKVMPVTAFDQLTQWRYVAMLSSPTTHIKNIVGNIYSGTLGQMSGAIASSIENSLIKSGKVNAKVDLSRGAEAGDEYLKSASGLSWKARSNAKVGVSEGRKLYSLKSKLESAQKALKNADDSTREAAQKKVADLEAQVEKAQKNFDSATGKIKSVSGAKAAELFHGKSRDALINDATKWEMHTSGASGKIIGKASEVVSNALETSDAVAVERIYRETADKVFTANNYEDWVKLANGTGKEAMAAKAKVKQIEEYAAQHAAYRAALDTYRNYNAVASWMNKVVKNTVYNADAKWYKKVGGFILHAVMPFTKVPTNIVKRSIDYSPIGLVKGKKALNKAIESGNFADINNAVERLSEGLIGTGIASLGLGMGMIDPDGMMITTRLNRDDERDKAKKDRGYMDYSVRIGNKDYTLEWATPTASTFFVGVEIGRMLRETYEKIAVDHDFEFNVWDAIQSSGEIMTRAIEPCLQLTMFQGVNGVLEDSMDSRYDDANISPIFKALGNIANNYVSSMQPSILNRLSRAFAPYDYYISGGTTQEYKKNLMLSKVPILSEQLFDAKTDAWGNPKNAPKTAGEKVLKAGVTLLSPMNVSNVTWDETDTKLYDLYDKTGDDKILPKVFYDYQNKGLQLGRNKDSAIDIDLTNNDAAQYNLAKGKAGEDAMAAALESVIFNRRTKDAKGVSIPRDDAYTQEQKNALISKYKGKGTKDVVEWVMEQPEFKNATELEQKKIIKDIVGNGDTEASVGAKRASELTVAKRHNISEDEYNYRNEVTGKKQEELDAAIEAGILTYKDVVDFNRGAAKVGYYTEEDSGGYSKSSYNRKNILAYLDSTSLSEDAKEALYNAYFTGKTPYGASVSRGYGYRGYGGWRHYGGGYSRKAKVPTPKKISASSLKKGEALVSKKGSSSTKATLPTLKRVEAKIDLPTVKTTKR